jgi:hypothetical protein
MWQEDAHRSHRVVSLDESRSMDVRDICSIVLGKQVTL